MSLGRSRDEQELTRHLAETLVEREVMAPMEKIGWGHGNPPPPEQVTTTSTEGAPAPALAPAAAPQGGLPATAAPAAPATAAPAKADAPAPDLNTLFESLRDPATGKIMGKYDNIEQALKGAGHLATMAKTSFQQRDAALEEAKRLREENEQLRRSPGASPAPAPSHTAVPSASRAEVERAQAAYDAVLSDVAQNGGVLDEENSKRLAKANSELVQVMARAAAEEVSTSRDSVTRAEQEKWDRVDAYMRDKYPESMNFTDEMGLHIRANPLLQSAVNALAAQGKEIEATELAWQDFDKVRLGGQAASLRAEAETKEIELSAREQVRKEAVERARADAGIVHGSPGGGGVHERPDAGGLSREQIAAMGDAMRMHGEAPGTPAAAAWREATIGRFLDPAIFGA